MGLETALLGKRRIAASKARRKEGKFAKWRAGSLRGESLSSFTSNQASLVAKYKQNKKKKKAKAGIRNFSIKM